MTEKKELILETLNDRKIMVSPALLEFLNNLPIDECAKLVDEIIIGHEEIQNVKKQL